MAAHNWALVLSALVLAARVLQHGPSAPTGFVGATLPLATARPLHLRMHSPTVKWNPRTGLQPRRSPHLLPQRGSRMTRHFVELLGPLIEVTSVFASATEGVLGLGALSAEVCGGTISGAIAIFDAEFLVSLPGAPALLGAVEADWLAAIAASLIGSVETDTLVELGIAGLERSEVGGMMAVLTEEKQVEFACGVLSRCSPAELAQLLRGLS